MQITREEKQQVSPTERSRPIADEIAAEAAARAVAAAKKATPDEIAAKETLAVAEATAAAFPGTAQENTPAEAAAKTAVTDAQAVLDAAMAKAEETVVQLQDEAKIAREKATEARAALTALGNFETDAQCDARSVALVLSALARAGLDLPATDPPSLDDVRAHIEALCLARIKAEIVADDFLRLYAGKSAAEIADLMNAPFQDTSDPPRAQLPRAAVIFMAIPYAPNAVTTQDVEAAQS